MAYAYLRNQLEPKATSPRPMPKETTWVFEHGIETPRAIHVHTRVCDVMTAQVLSVDLRNPLFWKLDV